MDQQIKTISNIPPEKPSALVFNDAKMYLTNAVNVILRDYALPFWLVEIIIKDLAQDIKTQANIEIKTQEQAWQRQKAQYEMERSASTTEETVDITTENKEVE